MEFEQLVRRRRMVRNYDPDRPVPPEVVDRLLDRALRAPSAGFSQGWGFLVLADPADRERFWEATTVAGATTRWLAGMRRAPLIVVAHSCKETYLNRYAEPDKVRRLGPPTTPTGSDRDEARWPVPYWHIDTGMAVLLMLLTAVDEGLGACLFGVPPERTGEYREAFGVPPELTPIGAVTVGYPAPDRRSPSLRRGRRSRDEVVRYGRWSPVTGASPPTRREG